ncbi:AAA family ATPase [Streptomyces sp. NRRL S-350]|uniref:AAA family ATPase n=1 Tax=Streptomyces sp. NRRL S-350 TaxID=1463902 RepID=UPI000690C02D|nr:AAA family ATPase [Streptomyces sp. NRRL S-350]
MTKQNQSRAGRRARKAQQDGSTAQYTELLRAGGKEPDARPAVPIASATPGGEGKTTHAVDLRAGLAEYGQRVVLVDLDSQNDARLSAASQEEPAGGWPYRLVDAQWQGWLTAGNGLYRASSSLNRPGLEEPWPYARIVAERGPVRPVNHPVEGDDSTERLAALWDKAGRKAVASTLVALYRAVLRFPASLYGPHPLTSGREGSWESARLLNLAYTVGGDLDDRPKRFDPEVADGVADVLEGWVRRPETYTEVAENLAGIFGRYADRAGGWTKVADQWLQPGARAGHDPDTVFAVGSWLLLGSSEHLQAFLDSAHR